jgi:serine/threonine protein kinase
MALKFHDRSNQSTGDIDTEAVITRQLGGIVGDLYLRHGQDTTFGPWLLLRWIDGQRLRHKAESLRTLPAGLPEHAFLVLFAQLAQKYSEVHRLGILHADVQPSHVLLEPRAGREPQLVLLDWGLGRTQSQSAAYRGALAHFVAPEVAAGMRVGSRTIGYDTAAEIYAIGAVMYYCLTGQTAVDYGSSPLTEIPLKYKLEQTVAGRLRGFSPGGSRLKQHLQGVITDCLSTEPANRPSSAAQLRDMIVNN